MTKGDWVGYLISYLIVAWFLFAAHGKPLDDQVFNYFLCLFITIRAEAKRTRLEAEARADG
jgi:hypothetical protein